MADIITVLIGLGSGTLATFIIQAFQVKKTKAEAKKTSAEADKAEAGATEQIRQTCMGLINPLSERIGHLELQLKESEKTNLKYLRRIEYLMDGIRKLLLQIEGASLKPVWQPDDWQSDDES